MAASNILQQAQTHKLIVAQGAVPACLHGAPREGAAGGGGGWANGFVRAGENYALPSMALESIGEVTQYCS